MLEELKNSTDRSKKIEQLAQTLKASGFARNDMQARMMAEEMVGVEASVQENFEKQVYKKTSPLIVPEAMSKKPIQFEDIEEKKLKLEKEIIELEEKKKIMQENIRSLREKALNKEKIIVQNEYDTPSTRIKDQQEKSEQVHLTSKKNDEQVIEMETNEEQTTPTTPTTLITPSETPTTLSDLMETELEELTPTTQLRPKLETYDLESESEPIQPKEETEDNNIDKTDDTSVNENEQILQNQENEKNSEITENIEVFTDNSETASQEEKDEDEENQIEQDEHNEEKTEKPKEELKPVDVSEEKKVDLSSIFNFGSR